ncbi:MAG: type I-C CRISPR-associated endonuclease Cas1c [Geminicoccaceae bacterium]|nr:type I-C CRISPR-associated endonuclease Cas1c [Geminicoccaceae bacterium]MDW8126021.1 type I-C CRISPR-associated endonuclease Cas1c [Geminicoccaceae bacterium]
MKRYLNTLYVTTQGARLRRDGQNLVIAVEGEEKARFPIHGLGGVVALGRVSASPAALELCAEHGTTVTYLTETGRFLARVEGPVSGNVLLRREQYRRSADEACCAPIVRSLVIGKAVNQRAVVRRALRDHGERMGSAARSALEEAERRLTDVARRAQRAADVDALRGLEGEAGRVYFGVFRYLILVEDEGLGFEGRTRRPPLDPVNASLSFVYTLLTHDLRSACETVGLDPAVGFLHRDRPGRPSLALDLAEEFRPWFADRLVLSLINRRQLCGRDFRKLENGAVLLSDDARRSVIVAYQERKREELRHPILEETTTIGLLPLIQAQLLARHLRGDLDAYPPFFWK